MNYSAIQARHRKLVQDLHPRVFERTLRQSVGLNTGFIYYSTLPSVQRSVVSRKGELLEILPSAVGVSAFDPRVEAIISEHQGEEADSLD